MIDIHSHILPGIDDGARDIFDTLEMAQIAVESGIREMIVTPHCNVPGRFRNYFSEEYITVFENTVELLEKEGIPLTLYPGMEVFASYDLPDLLVDKKIMPLNQSRYVLMEFSFDEEPDYAMDVLRRVREVGARPVIAHAERYEFIQDNPQYAYEWRKYGYQIQVNKGSFRGGFGSKVEDTAFKLLKNNLITAIASDAHGTKVRTPYMKDIYELVQPVCGKMMADILFHENPARICNNQPVKMAAPVPFI